MPKTRAILVSLLLMTLVAFAWRLNAPLFAAQPDEVRDAQAVEYKVVRARELGIIVSTNVQALSTDFEKHLNKLAAQGWRWKEFVPAGPQSFPIFVRRK